MVKGKRGGSLFVLYLVALSLFMSGAVLFVFEAHGEKLQGALVSPLAVLEIRDQLEVFEINEKKIIFSSLDESDWGSEGFGERFRERFVSRISGEVDRMEMEGFWDGVSGDFLYDVYTSGNDLILERRVLEKRGIIEPASYGPASFSVGYIFDYSAEYLIKLEGSKFVVERVS